MDKKDHMLWCYEIQKRNSGFVCPDYNSLRDHGLLGNYEKYGLNSLEQRHEKESNTIIKSWQSNQVKTENMDTME